MLSDIYQKMYAQLEMLAVGYAVTLKKVDECVYLYVEKIMNVYIS